MVSSYSLCGSESRRSRPGLDPQVAPRMTKVRMVMQKSRLPEKPK